MILDDNIDDVFLYGVLMSNNFQDLVNIIHDKYNSLNDFSVDSSKKSLNDVFFHAMQKSVQEIGHGADSADFAELTIMNFIIMGDSEGYQPEDLKSFISELKNNDDNQ